MTRGFETPQKISWLAPFVIAAVAFVAYQPALRIQFYDGWWYLEWAATMDLPRYAIQFLDPANVTQGYRPVQGLYMLILYRLFGFNPDGYHLAHTLLHAADAILLWLIVARVGARVMDRPRAFQVGLIAALLYAVSPVITLAIFWHAVVDPLSAFFYLLTILLWAKFLETERRADWLAAFAAYLFALFSKEVSIFLPPILFLIEWWIYRKKISLAPTARRYLLFLLVWIPYLYLVVQVQSHGEFSSQFGFKLGPHMLNNLLPYLAVLTLPWTNELPRETIYFVWLGLAAVVYLGVTIWKRSLALLLIGIAAGLNISPLTGFPLDYFNTRYLYLSLMSTAIVAALVSHFIARKMAPCRVWAIVLSAVITALVIASSVRVADAAATLAEYTRQTRVPFRDVTRLHPTFPNDTYIYFVYSPTTSVWDFKGLFFTRYGVGVKVDATDSGYAPELHQHDTAYVYYFDSSGLPGELPVEKAMGLRASSTLPARFDAPIVLETYAVASATLKRARALVILLNWRATAKVDADYTVFAHLVDATGALIAQSDAPPRRGESRTSSWEANQLIVDAIVLPIPPDAPLGENFQLELGLYDSATMQRAHILGANGERVNDKLVIESFRIVP